MLEKLTNPNPHILVIGDLMVDTYLWGDSSRISPEAPVQVIDIKKETKVLGGAGNVVNNLRSLKAKVSVMSVIGNCEISNDLIKLLTEINVDCSLLIRDEKRVTSKKTRIISSKQQVVRFDIESTENINQNFEKELVNRLKKKIREFDLIILSDYGKGVLTNSLTKEIISISNREKIKVIADPKGSDYGKYKNSFLLTPNKKEACEATNIEIIDEDSLYLCLHKLKERCNLQVSLITLSEDGIGLLDNKLRIHPTVAREVFDVTGAGDTVISSLGYALANNLNIDDAVKFSNLAAGVVVGKIGSATASLDEIFEYESSLHLSECEEHIKDKENIKSIVNKAKSKNKRVVFTNGCFDIIHVGHVKYLSQAKKLGDILIVGLNSDDSIRKLKGKTRPINLLKDRACVLGSLESVDYVVPFNDETPSNLIKYIKPDVLVKGSDYKGKDIAGAEFVSEIILIDFINGKSTSNIIKKIKND